MRKPQIFSSLGLATIFVFSAGCNLSDKESVSEGEAKISSIHMTSNGALRLSGSVGGVKKLKIKTDAGVVPLKIIKEGETSIEAATTSFLKLSPGKIYGLIVSSANADEAIIPIQLDMPVQGPAGPQGPQGTAGTNGATGAQGPVGPPGRGASIVIKDANGQTAAYFMGHMDPHKEYDDINSHALVMFASTGKIAIVSLTTGRVAKTAGYIYFTNSNCTGQTYLNYRSGVPLPTLGHIIRTNSDQYYEIAGFVPTVVAQSYRAFNGVNAYPCYNRAETLGNPYDGSPAAVINPVSAPQSFESLAPIRLQLE